MNRRRPYRYPSKTPAAQRREALMWVAVTMTTAVIVFGLGFTASYTGASIACAAVCMFCRSPLRLDGTVWLDSEQDSPDCWERDAEPCPRCESGCSACGDGVRNGPHSPGNPTDRTRDDQSVKTASARTTVCTRVRPKVGP